MDAAGLGGVLSVIFQTERDPSSVVADYRAALPRVAHAITESDGGGATTFHFSTAGGPGQITVATDAGATLVAVEVRP